MPSERPTLKMDPFKESRVAKIEAGNEVAITYANPYHIPDVLRGTDQCPGCGALMQCREQFRSGFTSLKSIKKHIEEHDRMMKLRERYYTRQEKLHENIKAVGWQPEFEYQDYLTEEELHAVHRYQPKPVVCERCQHINSYTYGSEKAMMPVHEWQMELAEIDEKAKKRSGRPLVVLVVSLWDFEGGFTTEIVRFLRRKPVLMVGTFGDAIPIPWVLKKTDNWNNWSVSDQEKREKWTVKHLGKLGAWMKARARDARLRILDAIAVGNEHESNIDLVAAAIEHHRATDGDVYFVGGANVGKSSLLNNLIKFYQVPPKPHPDATMVTDIVRTGHKTEYLRRWEVPEDAASPQQTLAMTIGNPYATPVQTVSGIPGTTLKNIGLKIRSKKGEGMLIDTPGVVSTLSIFNVLPLGVASMVTPKRRAHLDFFNVVPGDSLFISAMVRIDVVKGPPKGVLLRAVARWNRVTHKIVPTETADIFYEKWRGVKMVLSPPNLRPTLDAVGGLVNSKVIYLDQYATATDICVPGLVFLCPAQEPAPIVLKVHTVKGLSVITRPSIYDLKNIHPPRKLLTRRKKSRKYAEPYLMKIVEDKYGVERARREVVAERLPVEDDEDDEDGML
eukprot:TRINITY_DN12119_c0_g1_i4.p1 TRINITY_DN12119_c0_g1~~TRINITY_DN12119_c0_g1_i4.p1  ORF type:complete len:727 (+),score=139.56 TRINITY_DN12119_c0_g1_i4:328-2181(+)